MNISTQPHIILSALLRRLAIGILGIFFATAHADERQKWEIESDLHSDFAWEEVTVTINGKRHAQLKTSQKNDATNALAPYRPAPGPHFYELSGKSQPSARGEKALKIVGQGWLYTQRDLDRDFAALAPASTHVRIQKIQDQWRPRIKRAGGELITTAPHAAESAKNIAAAEARIGMKLPKTYVAAVSQPYFAFRPAKDGQPEQAGLMSPDAIISVFEWLKRPRGDTPRGERAFKRTARHFILASGEEMSYLIARDDDPDAGSRAVEPRLQQVTLNEETSTEDSDAYEFYPFDAPRSRNVTLAQFSDAAALLELKRGLVRAGVTLLGDGTDTLRLWRLDIEDGVLGMELRYTGYDSIEVD